MNEEIGELKRRLLESEAYNSVLREALTVMPRVNVSKTPSEVYMASWTWMEWINRRNKALSTTAGKPLLEERDRLRNALSALVKQCEIMCCGGNVLTKAKQALFPRPKETKEKE